MTAIMDAGETRHVRLKVSNVKGEDFSILDAKYELWDKGGALVDSGSADILEHIMDVVVSPDSAGTYILAYTYTIGDETLIDRVRVVAC